MPVDAHGNVTDCIIFGGSTFRRSNFGRLYEHFWNACSRDLIHRLRTEFGFERLSEPSEEQLSSLTKQQLEYTYNEIMEFLSIAAPTQNSIIGRHPNKHEYVLRILKKGYVVLYIDIEENINLMDVTAKLLESRFTPLRQPLTFTDYDGNKKQTHDAMIVAPLHLILLEKIGDDWSGVASVKTQQFGLPAKLNAMDRYATPGKESAVRSFGESETRSFNSTVGPEITNEIMDMTNNPDSHNMVIEAILTAPRPTDIERAVGRRRIPYGGSRAVQSLNHLLETRGLKFKYVKPK